jgi:hypothetical protein
METLRENDLSFTGTTAELSTQNFSVGDLLTIHRALHDSFVNSFEGITIRVDSDLKQNEFYCAVSQEMFDEINKRYAEKHL